MTVYANSTAGAGDGDYGNLLNYWDDASATIPHLSVPNSGDDVIQQDAFTTGTLSCKTLNSGGQATTGNATITCATSATSVAWGASGTFTSPLYTSTTFNTTPGATINGVSCSYQADMNLTMNISGSSTFGAFAFNGTITNTGSLSIDAAATFGGTFTPNTNLSSGQFAATVSMAGFNFGAELTGGNLLCSGFTGTQTAGAIVVTGPSAVYHPASYVSGTTTFSNSPNPIFTRTIVHQGMTDNGTEPPVAAVLNTTSPYGQNSGLSGDYTPVAQSDVKKGVTYGPANSLTGSLASGGASGGNFGIGIGI